MKINKERILDFIKSKDVIVVIDRTSASKTSTNDEGKVVITLHGDQNEPMMTMVTFHEVFHALGILNKRMYLNTEHKGLVEELAANEFAREMTEMAGEMTEEVKTCCDYVEKSILKKLKNKIVAKKQAKVRANNCIELIKEELK